MIRDFGDPSIAKESRVLSSARLGGKNSVKHAVLTGPNRGGKSTLLKSIGIAVLMSHTVGIVFAKEASVPRFANIITALAPQDVVGKLSLFEAEIEFAKEVKGLLGPKTFLMMDEIFHGTNAHDGVEASQVFLDDIYTTKNKDLFSIVSTHYMNLPERYAQVQHLCMEASVSPTDPDRLVYTYKVSPGVNRFSSVREILQERGLLRRCGSAD
jgi:DNA mismatch repair ATPase MutS